MQTRRVKFHIWDNGDPSVGIPGNHAELEVDIVDGDEREFICVSMQEAFRNIWDCGHVFIATDEDLDKLSEEEKIDQELCSICKDPLSTHLGDCQEAVVIPCTPQTCPGAGCPSCAAKKMEEAQKQREVFMASRKRGEEDRLKEERRPGTFPSDELMMSMPGVRRLKVKDVSEHVPGKYPATITHPPDLLEQEGHKLKAKAQAQFLAYANEMLEGCLAACFIIIQGHGVNQQPVTIHHVYGCTKNKQH